MKKLSGNYTMGEAMNYCKVKRIMNILGAIFFFFFAFYPPFYLGLDPRYEPHIFPFYAYYTIYVFVYAVILGKFENKPRKINKIVMERAIWIGCPVEVRQIGAKSNNSYGTFVKVNEEMMAILKEVRLNDNLKMVEENKAMKEPFVKELSLGAGTTEKFIGKNIPNFDKARKIGKIVGESK